jgi:flagellar biosynthesis/type III secretory pathway protein FliH
MNCRNVLDSPIRKKMKPHKESQTPVHRFPDFAGSDGEANGAAPDPFHPLFRDAAASDTHPSPDSPEADARRQLEQARHRGYLKGLEAGRQDALRMSENRLAPHADRFLQARDRLAKYQQYIADHASAHMLKLAVEISERIMGADAHVTAADLQQLRTALIEAICKRYELHLRFNPNDLSGLKHLMKASAESDWRISDGLSFDEDSDIPQGAVTNGREAEEGSSIETQVRPSLQKLLMSAERAGTPDRTGASGPLQDTESISGNRPEQTPVSTK